MNPDHDELEEGDFWGPGAPSLPTSALPGTGAKVAVLMARFALGGELFVRGDAAEQDLSFEAVSVPNCEPRRGRVVGEEAIPRGEPRKRRPWDERAKTPECRWLLTQRRQLLRARKRGGGIGQLWLFRPDREPSRRRRSRRLRLATPDQPTLWEGACLAMGA